MKESKDSFKLLLLASFATLFINLIPQGKLLLYPFNLFVTYVHETCHALAGWLTLGSVSGMTINPDTSGVTYVLGGSALLVYSAGYLGSTIFGALLLILCHKEETSKKILAVLAAAVLAVTVFFIGVGYTAFFLTVVLSLIGLLLFAKPNLSHGLKVALSAGGIATFFTLIAFLAVTNNLFGWIAGLTLTTVLFLSAKFLPARAAHFFLSFLAIQSCLNALVDIKTLWFISAASSNHSDAQGMFNVTGIPAIFWATLWGFISLVILAVSLFIHHRVATKGKIFPSK